MNKNEIKSWLIYLALSLIWVGGVIFTSAFIEDIEKQIRINAIIIGGLFILLGFFFVIYADKKYPDEDDDW